MNVAGSMDGDAQILLRLAFEAEVIYWRGPSPFFFVVVPGEDAAEIRRVSKAVTYGWGMAPVQAKVGGIDFGTALFPKDGSYLLPVKAAVRRAASITAGDTVSVEITLAAR